ncbi:MAG: hypothetical protein AAF288_00600 [Planctomycetota bacterium]
MDPSPTVRDILPPTAADPEVAPGTPADRRRVVLCPYCGTLGENRAQCGSCGGLFEPLSRKATQVAMGAWYLRDPRQPFQPGCSMATLRRMVAAGRIGPTTVLRGPSTRQFWSIARNVPGVSHLVGYCYHCGAKVPRQPEAERCHVCDTGFARADRRNHLGLMYDSPESLAKACAEIDRATGRPGQPAAAPTTEITDPGPPPANGQDLLSSVFNLGTSAGEPGTNA